jgi:uncharacterized protein YbjT (DUF2867 family)
MRNILVLGGTGFVGRHLCEKLARLQWRVTVPTRRANGARDLQMLPLLQPVQADVRDEAVLTRLVAGHDAVVNLVAILHGNEAAFEAVHVTLPQALARACAAAGVQRVVHVSALGAAVDAPSMYQRSKARGEAALRAAGLALTVLRPSVIFGPEDRFLNLFARLQAVLPVVPLAGADTRFQPVWVEDVAQAVAHALQNERTAGQIYEACGPGVYTLRQLVRLAGQWAGVNGGRGRPVLGLPARLARLQALLMELAPGEPLMSRDNLDAMLADNVASGRLPGLESLGIQPGALEAIAPAYLGSRGLPENLQAFRRTAGR